MKLSASEPASPGAVVVARPESSAAALRTDASSQRWPLWRVRSYLLLAAAIALFIVGTTWINWVKHVSLRSNWAFDLAYVDNIASNMAHGRTFTYFFGQAYFDWREFNGGPSIFRMDHQRLVYLALAPLLYSLYPSVVSLMAMQSAFIGLGALPLYWLGVTRTGEARVGLLLAASYLLHPTILQLGFDEFHEIKLALAPALFALWYFANRQPLGFGIAAFVLLACRAEYAFLLAAFGVLTWRLVPRVGGRWRWIAASLLGAALWAAITNVYFLYTYDQPWPLFLGNPYRPPPLLALLGVWTRLPMVAAIGLLPALLGYLLMPEALLVSIPFIASSGGIKYPSLTEGDLRHLSPTVAILFWAFAFGVTWLWLRSSPTLRARLALALASVALVCFGGFAVVVARTYLLGGFPHYEEIDALNESLPWDATVLVPRELTARFSQHSRLLDYELLPVHDVQDLNGEEYRAIVYQLVRLSDLVAVKRGEDWLDQLVARSGRFRAPEVISKFKIYRARPDAPRPKDADLQVQRLLRWDQLSDAQARWFTRPPPAETTGPG